MFDDPNFITAVINSVVIALAMIWVARSAVKNERKRRLLEDVEKGMQVRKNKSPPVAQDPSPNDHQ